MKSLLIMLAGILLALPAEAQSRSRRAPTPPPTEKKTQDAPEAKEPTKPEEPPPPKPTEVIAGNVVKSITKAASDGKDAGIVIVLDDDVQKESSLEEALTGLLKALEQSSLHQDGKLSVGIVALSEKPYIAHKVTKDLGSINRALRAVKAKNPGLYKNTLAAVRLAAPLLRSIPGQRAVVLLTDANGDSEDNLERTAKILKTNKIRFYAIAPEATYSDHYWSAYQLDPGEIFDHQARDYVKLGFTLYGQESAHVEFPYVWFFMTRGYYNWEGDFTVTVPSGFTCYGLSRLSAESKGKAHILPMDAASYSFCYQVSCTICSRKHKECDAVYDPIKLQLTAPKLDPRVKSYTDMRRNASWRFIYLVWEAAFRQGVVGFGPPKVDGMPVLDVPGKKKTPISSSASGSSRHYSRTRNAFRPPGVLWYYGYDINWRKKAVEATQYRAKLEKLASQVRRAMKSANRKKVDRRALATADALLAYLMIGKMNYQQWEYYCYERARKRDVEIGRKQVGQDVTSTYLRDYIRYSFCHGAAALKDLPIEGDKRLRKEWIKSCDLIQETIDRHKGTPWEILVRRAVIVGWKPYTYKYTIAAPSTRGRSTSGRTGSTATPSSGSGGTATPQGQSRPAAPKRPQKSRSSGSSAAGTATPGGK